MILVDEAVWPRDGQVFAHLASSESLEELHEFAARLGVRQFHNDHYDLPADRVQDAIGAGALQVGTRTIARALRDSGLRRRTAGAPDGPLDF